MLFFILGTFLIGLLACFLVEKRMGSRTKRVTSKMKFNGRDVYEFRCGPGILHLDLGRFIGVYMNRSSLSRSCRLVDLDTLVFN